MDQQVIMNDQALESGDLYVRNLELLKVHCPELFLRLKEHQDRIFLKIVSNAEGDEVVLSKEEAGWSFFHNQDAYHKKTAFQEMDQYREGIKNIGHYGFCFLGLDAGTRLFYLFSKTDDHCPLIVIERHVELFRAIASRFDLSELIYSKRVFFFIGEDAVVMATAFLKGDFCLNLPLAGTVFCRQADQEYYQRSSVSLSEAVKSCFEQGAQDQSAVTQHYRKVNRDDLLKLFSPDAHEPLRILGESSALTKVMQYVTGDCLNAFSQLGHKTELMRTESSLISYRHILKVMRNFMPHMWFRINYPLRPVIPFDSLIGVTWVQDYLAAIFEAQAEAKKKIGRFDQLIVMTRHFMNDLRQLGFPESQIHYFNFGADPLKYFPMSLTKDDQDRYSCNIGFVANYPQLAAADGFLPSSVSNEIYEYMVNEEKYYPDDFLAFVPVLEKKYGAFTIGRVELMSNIWAALSTAAVRLPYLESVSDLGLAIFGDGWCNDRRFKDNARGRVESGYEAGKVYNASKITINLTPATNNHPRIFDAIASGGFVLTRLTREDEGEGGIGDLFEIGKEIEVFRSKEELREKALYYLKHEDQRREIARRGRERLLREHTMQHRMRQVLTIVYEGLKAYG